MTMRGIIYILKRFTFKIITNIFSNIWLKELLFETLYFNNKLILNYYVWLEKSNSLYKKIKEFGWRKNDFRLNFRNCSLQIKLFGSETIYSTNRILLVVCFILLRLLEVDKIWLGC